MPKETNLPHFIANRKLEINTEEAINLAVRNTRLLVPEKKIESCLDFLFGAISARLSNPKNIRVLPQYFSYIAYSIHKWGDYESRFPALLTNSEHTALSTLYPEIVAHGANISFNADEQLMVTNLVADTSRLETTLTPFLSGLGFGLRKLSTSHAPVAAEYKLWYPDGPYAKSIAIHPTRHPSS